MESLETSCLEFLKAKEYLNALGYEVLGVRDGSIENKEKIYSVRKKN